MNRLLVDAGIPITAFYGRTGKNQILQQLAGYNQAARHGKWFVLLDLDNDAECAPEFLQQVVPEPRSEGLIIRLAIREIEAWLLADRERIAAFLHVSPQRVPVDPDGLVDPKRELVHLASHSRVRRIRQGLVAADNPNKEGPTYTSELLAFIGDRDAGWRPDHARERSNSLDRCLDAIGALSLPE